MVVKIIQPELQPKFAILFIMPIRVISNPGDYLNFNFIAVFIVVCVKQNYLKDIERCRYLS